MPKIKDIYGNYCIRQMSLVISSRLAYLIKLLRTVNNMLILCDAYLRPDEIYFNANANTKRMDPESRQVRITTNTTLPATTRNGQSEW
jgi:hypothetical protein